MQALGPIAAPYPHGYAEPRRSDPPPAPAHGSMPVPVGIPHAPAPAPSEPPASAVVSVVQAPARLTAAEIFREHGAFVFRLLRRLGVPDSDLDDLTQDVFLIVHRSIDRYEERNHLRAWLYRISVREASRHRRSRPPASACDVESLTETEGPGPEASAQASEARADFDRLLSVLDEDRRTVFVLYEVEELPMEEVAATVGCPLGTAYSRLRSARKLVLAAARRLEAQRRSR